jgi:predicted O-linked N-acetylglucosamine transferase (SPINDLY family)
MLLFARRPAPVQVSYLGYPATTGLAAMDVRFTDRFLDPPDAAEATAPSIERLARLPAYWNYVPPAGAPEVNDLPARQDGATVTFVSLNHLGKVTPPVVEAWARILRAVPASRLMLYARGGAGGNSGPARAFEACGIGADRLRVIGTSPRRDFVARYQEADIALDPFPYNGGVTTLDALWMGVPVVTLSGARSLARAGACILSHVGLAQFIARTADEYVDIAVALAHDRAGRAAMRRGLRERLASSPLMDRPALLAGIEHQLLEAWEAWRQTA